MAVIKQSDLIQSITDALQFISYYHPTDFIQAMYEAYEKEESPAARNAIAQILINSRMSATGHRPLCQDTGIVIVFIKVGMNVQWDTTDLSIDEMINEGVRRAYTLPDNILRASILLDPAGKRTNSKDNTPAVIHTSIIPGNTIEIDIAAKGGGSENKAKTAMLNPSDSIVDWVLKTIPDMGAGWCPPGIIGLGIGGTIEKAALLAKESLMSSIDIHQLKTRGAKNRIEELRLELFDKINQLGIGAQGLGGLTTVLDVKILDYPTHAASLPVCIIPNCAATRHIHFRLDGSGSAALTPPSLDSYPEIVWEKGPTRHVDLNTITANDIKLWQPGETLLLNGKMLTGRDAAHKRMVDMLNNNETLPIDLKGRFIYYVGPVSPVHDEVVGPAGPTTSNRMDKFTRQILEQTGLLGMIGKAERGPEAIEAIKDNQSVYLMAVGGAAYLVAQAIKSAKILAFPELGMEAIYEFDVKDMPVTVAVDSSGQSVHISGPKKWHQIINDRLITKS